MDTCQYQFGSLEVDPRLTSHVDVKAGPCGALAPHNLKIKHKHTKCGQGFYSLCDEHFTAIRDAIYPLEAQFGPELDACKALKAASPKRRRK